MNAALVIRAPADTPDWLVYTVSGVTLVVLAYLLVRFFRS